MKIDKITGNWPNCISCQIAHDNSKKYLNKYKNISHKVNLIKQ